jgi:tetratricopeptide (TPR) repeat protein
VKSPVKLRPHSADADYYRLGYQLAAQLLNREAEPGLAAPAEPGAPPIINNEPLEVAQQLLDDARAVLVWLDARRTTWMRWRRPTPQEERLGTFLAETVEPCCAVIAARRLYQLGRADEAQAYVAEMRRRAQAGVLSYRAYYAVACLAGGTGARDEALAHLARALRDAPRNRREELAQWARNDPDFEGLRGEVRGVVEHVVEHVGT